MRAADGRAVTSIDPVVARPPRAGGAGGGVDAAPSIANVSGVIPNAGVWGRLGLELGLEASPLQGAEPVVDVAAGDGDAALGSGVGGGPASVVTSGLPDGIAGGVADDAGFEVSPAADAAGGIGVFGGGAAGGSGG